MSFFRTAYDTTIGSLIETEKISTAIQESMIRDYIYSRNKNELLPTERLNGFFITGRASSENDIPVFNYPLLINNFRDKDFIVCDVRTCFTSNKEGDFYLKNSAEYNFNLTKMLSNISWLSNHQSEMMFNLSFAAVIFSTWLSSSITRGYALNPMERLKLTIFNHYYYHSLFFNEPVLSEENKQKVALHTIKAFRAPAQLVFDVFDSVSGINNIDEYCNFVKSNLLKDNIRLENFSKGMLFTYISNSWFGYNAKEMLAVSLEHPPTWISIVYAAINERTYKQSMVARIVSENNRNKVADEFTKSFHILTDRFIDSTYTSN